MIEKVSIEALTHMNANLQISEDVVSLQSESCILHTNYIKILKQKLKTAMKLRLLCKTLSHVYHHKSRRMKKMITNSRTYLRPAIEFQMQDKGNVGGQVTV